MLLQLLIVFLPSSVLPTALTVDNVLRELKDISWKTLSDRKELSDVSIIIGGGILLLPASQRHKIETEYSTEDQWKKAAVQYWLSSDPYASWRRLITQLDHFEEDAVAKQIHRYAEKLTGMTCTLQIRGCPYSMHAWWVPCMHYSVWFTFDPSLYYYMLTVLMVSFKGC